MLVMHPGDTMPRVHATCPNTAAEPMCESLYLYMCQVLHVATKGFAGIRVLRAFRVLRLFKVFKYIKVH